MVLIFFQVPPFYAPLHHHHHQRTTSYKCPLHLSRWIRSKHLPPPPPSFLCYVTIPPVDVSSSTVEEEITVSCSSSSSSSEFPEIGHAKRVVLVRHGQSTWNEEGRIQGSSDFSVLTPKGESQAETSRQMLISDRFDVCFTSPLARSKRTAEIIWNGRKEEIIQEWDLREIDLYSFQGLLKHEGKARYGDEFEQWQIDAPNFNIDGHYPVRELWSRARSCWDKILEHKSQSVLVVAHNAVNQALIATVIGLGTEYFRVLLQSNCGVSVLDFTPSSKGGSPYISLNRLNQTPNSPIAAGNSAGRKAQSRIILVCHGVLQSNDEDIEFGNIPMNMLGIIQSQKTAELLLDLKVQAVVCSPQIAAVDTANAISRVQEAADCLGADCVPREVDIVQMQELHVDYQPLRMDGGSAVSGPQKKASEEKLLDVWERAGSAWQLLLKKLAQESESEKNLVIVASPVIHRAIIAHCLRVGPEWLGSLHMDEGSMSVIDFPDGPDGKGVIRCINYTAHLGRWSIPVTRPSEDAEEF